MSLKEIAKTVGLSSPAVLERIQKLEDLGYPLKFNISTQLKYSQTQKFFEAIKTVLDIFECIQLIGTDFIPMKGYVRDSIDLQNLNSKLAVHEEITVFLVLSYVIIEKILNGTM